MRPIESENPRNGEVVRTVQLVKVTIDEAINRGFMISPNGFDPIPDEA